MTETKTPAPPAPLAPIPSPPAVPLGLEAGEKKTKSVYGLLIKTDLTYEVVEHKNFAKAMGCQLELLDSGKCKRFAAYADEEGLVKDVGMNDLAAYVLDILGFNIRTFIAGVRGNILLVNIDDEKKIPQAEVEELLSLCKEIEDDDEDDDEEVMTNIIKKYKHLRLARGKGK